MSTGGIILLVVLVVLALLVIAGVMAATRKRRTRGLQERFGSEYDRAVDEHGSRKEAEHRMAEAADRRDEAQIRDLEPRERERYSRAWEEVQNAFVDDPLAATREADKLVAVVMRERGYPVDDFHTKSDMIAMDHPAVVEHYREAHAIGSRADEPSTEELRQGFVHYRALFVELLGDAQPTAAARTRAGTDDTRSDTNATPKRVAETKSTADAEPTRADGPDGSAHAEQLDLTREERATKQPRTG